MADAFCDACDGGDAETARLCLTNGADPNAVDQGFPAIYGAADNGHVAVVALLLKHGAAVDAANNVDGGTPLIIAAAKGHAEVAALLLRHGAAVDAANNNGGTPLMVAATTGHTEIVRALLLAGADASGSPRLTSRSK